MSEFSKVLQEELAEAQKDLHLFKDLLEHKGWMRLVMLMEKRIRVIEIEVCYGEDDLTVASLEHSKGILQGMMIVTQLPDMIKDAAKDSIKQNEERIDELDDEETAERS